MESARKNLLRSTARELLRDFDSPSNNLTLRQLLDKHAVKIARTGRSLRRFGYAFAVRFIEYGRVNNEVIMADTRTASDEVSFMRLKEYAEKSKSHLTRYTETPRSFTCSKSADRGELIKKA